MTSYCYSLQQEHGGHLSKNLRSFHNLVLIVQLNYLHTRSTVIKKIYSKMKPFKRKNLLYKQYNYINENTR